MPLEFSLAYFTPILAFVLVMTLVYAVLAKTKILGENASLNFLISFVVAMVFMLAPLARTYTLKTAPWLAVFLVCLFFFLLIITFVHANFETVLKSKWLSIALVLAVLVIFVVSGINVFGSLINSYLGTIGLSFGSIKDTLLQPSILGILVLLVISALLFWFLKGK
jgi:hypothetical protein